MRLLNAMKLAHSDYTEADENYIDAVNAVVQDKDALENAQADLLLEHTCKNEAERTALFRTQLKDAYELKLEREIYLNRASAKRREKERAWNLLRYELRLLELGKGDVPTLTVDSDETQAAPS